jgi:hypothetical protein
MSENLDETVNLLLQGSFLEKLNEDIQEIKGDVKGLDGKVDNLGERVARLEESMKERPDLFSRMGVFLVQTKDIRILHWIVGGMVLLVLQKWGPGALDFLRQLFISGVKP